MKAETLTPAPGAIVPAPLTAVDRAAAELRRGGMVVVTAGATGLLIQAAEAATPQGIGFIQQATGSAPTLAITGRRAAVLGFGMAAEAAIAVVSAAPHGLDAETVLSLTQPGALRPASLSLAVDPAEGDGGAGAGVRLAKIARLLPAALMAPVVGEAPTAWARRRDLPVVSVADVLEYDALVARTLRPVSEARVPLAGAEDTRIVAFRPGDGGIEHLAIIIGEPDPGQPVLARLHSECFTGDLLGSLRCDCGDQLRGAIEEIARAGSGVLIYLAQEGRGIGLVNKLRAYQLQDRGFDTLDANGQLGFDDDERIYLPAAEMLRQLGFTKVRLLTNNPRKVDALRRHDVNVIERVPHVFPENDHNASYLRTKATRGGHLF